MRRLLALATCLALLPGCATTWTLLKLGGVEPEEGSFSRATPLGPTERRVVVEPTAVPRQDQPVFAAAPEPQAADLPPPEVLLPPVVEIEPAPGPPEPCDGPPSPLASWEPPPEPAARSEPELSAQLACMLQQRPARELVHHESFSYDVGWKAVTAFMTVSESAIAALLVNSHFKERGRGENGLTPLVVGSYLALDALGTALLFFLPTKHNVTEFEREGSWSSAPGCPAGLSASVGGRAYRVAPDGRLEADGGARVFEQLTTPGSAFELRLEDRARSVRPSPGERCEWAKRHGRPLPPAECPMFELVLMPPVKAVIDLAPIPAE